MRQRSDSALLKDKEEVEYVTDYSDESSESE